MCKVGQHKMNRALFVQNVLTAFLLLMSESSVFQNMVDTYQPRQRNHQNSRFWRNTERGIKKQISKLII